MWMMLPCLLVVAFVVVAGGGNLRSWPFLAAIGAMVAVHLWMMLRGHGSHGGDHSGDTAPEAEAEEIKSSAHEKKDHSCCH